MNIHDEEVEQKLRKVNNIPDLAFRYVDDERYHLRGLKPGWRWDLRSEVMVYRTGWKEEDTRDKLTTTQLTARELQKILESVHTELKFEMETAEDFESHTLPTLDFQCWVEKGKILYKFYSKPMAKRTLIMKTSALGENSKIASLTQEVVRRSKNTSEDVCMDKRVEILDEYHRRLMLSQYSLEASRRIMVAGLRGYERIREKAARTGGNINRSEEEGAAGRYKKKLLGKSTWFKKTKDNDQQFQGRRRRRRMSGGAEPAPPVTSVLFVPKTQDSGLARGLQEVELRLSAITKERVRVTERGGKSLLQLLHTNDPFAGAPCGRDTCIPCNNSDKEKKENCDKRGIVYETFCRSCLEVAKAKKARGEEAPVYLYVGTSHLAMADRGADHLRDSERGMRKKFDGSHMARHALEMHPGEEPKFGMTIVRTYNNTFTRAMGEVVRILYRSKEKGVVLLNSKAGDYGSYSLPRLSVHNWEEEKHHQNVSLNGNSSDLSSKAKVKLKPPCFNVGQVKTTPATKRIYKRRKGN